MRKLLAFFSFALISVNVWSQTGTAKPVSPKPAAKPHSSSEPVAVFDTTAGKMRCTLFEKETPETVANFIGLATGTKDWKNPVSGATKHGVPLYDGTIFHRVIPNFMIQGGDPAGNGMGGPGYEFEDETKGSPHKFDKPGKLAMANSGPNTNGSQFFITVAPTTWLTGKHTIFGEVAEGQSVVEKISKVPRDRQDKPLKPGEVKSLKIER